jgi:hypothetical protein
MKYQGDSELVEKLSEKRVAGKLFEDVEAVEIRKLKIRNNDVICD